MKNSLQSVFASPHSNKPRKINQKATFSPDVADSCTPDRKKQRVSTPLITPERRLIRQPAEERKKTFNDPIHGSIELDELCLRIVDSVQYKRLHGLKQLGVCENVSTFSCSSRPITHTLECRVLVHLI